MSAASTQAAELEAHLAHLAGTSLPDPVLQAATQLGDFAPCMRSLSVAQILARLAEGLADYSALPSDALEAVNKRLKDLVGTVDGLARFEMSLMQVSPAAGLRRIQSLITQLKGGLDEFFGVAAPLLSIIIGSRNADLARDAGLQKAAGRLTAAEERAEALNRTLSDLLRKANIPRHARLFHAAARLHQRSARHWMSWTAVLVTPLALAVGLNVWLAFSSSSRTDWHLLISIAIALSLVASMAVWMSRMYRAAKHNETVNEHRGLALSTFETFAAHGESADARNAILMYAAKAVFDAQPTGFAGADPEPPMHILELLKGTKAAG